MSSRPLGDGRPVAMGQDRVLPGAGVQLSVTVWRGERSSLQHAEAPMVVLLHGLASQRRFWNLVVPGLVSAGLPVVAIDQRGHGDSERPEGPYDVATCAADVLSVLASLGPEGRDAVVVGHSWGASVALAVAGAAPEMVRAVVAVDGGLTTPARLGLPLDDVRKRLEPPRLAVPPEQFAAMVASGPLAGLWSPAHEQAVLPAFAVGDDGLARARLPFDLHMRVLDGLLAVDVEAALTAVRCPAWAVSCEPVERGAGEGGPHDPAYHDDSWARARAEGLERAARLLAQPRLLRWAGAVHDVPLQWPALVSGLVRAAYDEVSPDPRWTGQWTTPSGGSA